ncbi:MAG: Crp/Fnr family transcriptional regulator [Treponema sp.]|jgi:CRP-like cAMP-binding protein|nr:Crp/Fnr family transcriptional regulator [Treponema sp.]
MLKIKEYSVILNSTKLLKGIEAGGLESMLTCIGARTKSIKKGKVILFAGDKPEFVGIVLAGQLHIIREDYNGNRLLVTAIGAGGIFAEALCCAGVSESPVTVIAAADSSIMLIDFSRILRTCSNSCSFHGKLIENLLGLTAEKNLLLQSRIEILSMKSVREKVMCYLESFIPKQGVNITIPFNREEMAVFLNVDRSALSHELAKMKRDGLIDYRKNLFVIKQTVFL